MTDQSEEKRKILKMIALGEEGDNTLKSVQESILDILLGLSELKPLVGRVNRLENIIEKIEKEYEHIVYERSQLKESHDDLRDEFKRLSNSFDELEGALERNTDTNKAQLEVVSSTILELKLSVEKLSTSIITISETQKNNQETIEKSKKWVAILPAPSIITLITAIVAIAIVAINYLKN